MVKKAAQLLGIFVFLFILNTYLMIKAYAHQKKNTKIAIILDEFSLDAQLADAEVLGATDQADFVGEDGEDLMKDERVAILKAFLRQRESPLYDHAELIVQTADKYELDFRLIPAISIQESGGCRKIPPGSHNCWGWGIYGTTVTRFNSYPEAIETVSKGLKLNYIDKGYVTPDEIMRKYNPSSPEGSWARGVNSFFGALQL